MTVSSTTPRNNYTGNGATLAYAYGFQIFSSADLLVTVRDTSTPPVETTLVLNTDYTVSNVGVAAGGTVTLVDASQTWLTTGFLKSSYLLTIRRKPALTQSAAIRNLGAFYPSVHEDEFDLLLMQIQSLRDEMDRAIRAPECDTATLNRINDSVTRASKYLGFDSSGQPAVLAAPAGTTTLSAFGAAFVILADALAARNNLGASGGLWPVSLGGTGLSTFSAAGALPYSTAAGTLAALAKGTAFQFLRMNSGATAPAWGSDIAALAPSVGSSALTIALKGLDGNNPSATNPFDIVFRNSTLTSGTPALCSVTGSLSIVVSSGSTLGHASAVAHDIYIYAINNAGTVELAVSSHGFWNEGLVYSTTAEGGAGAADSSAVLYSTTARTNVAIRLIGKLVSTQATAGTWATTPSVVQGLPVAVTQVLARANLTTAQTGITNKVIPFNVIGKDTVNGFSAGTYTVKAPGDYRVNAASLLAALDGSTDARLQIRKNTTAVADCYGARIPGGSTTAASMQASDVIPNLVAGDTIDIFVLGDASFDIDSSGARTYVAIERIGA